MAPKIKRVSFNSIEIVEFPMILGDHPACRIGPPVQTSWDAQRRTSIDVDEYELTRCPRRSVEQLHLSSTERSVMWVDWIPWSMLSLCFYKMSDKAIFSPSTIMYYRLGVFLEDDDASISSSGSHSPSSSSSRFFLSSDPETLIDHVNERMDRLMARMHVLDEDLYSSSQKRYRRKRRVVGKPRRINSAWWRNQDAYLGSINVLWNHAVSVHERRTISP
jgi:hypothetical protein